MTETKKPQMQLYLGQTYLESEVFCTHRSPPPGIWYAAEWCTRLIHLHRVHQSGEGEDAHGNEKKQTAYLNKDRRANVNNSGHSYFGNQHIYKSWITNQIT